MMVVMAVTIVQEQGQLKLSELDRCSKSEAIEVVCGEDERLNPSFCGIYPITPGAVWQLHSLVQRLHPSCHQSILDWLSSTNEE